MDLRSRQRWTVASTMARQPSTLLTSTRTPWVLFHRRSPLLVVRRPQLQTLRPLIAPAPPFRILPLAHRLPPMLRHLCSLPRPCHNHRLLRPLLKACRRCLLSHPSMCHRFCPFLGFYPTSLCLPLEPPPPDHSGTRSRRRLQHPCTHPLGTHHRRLLKHSHMHRLPGTRHCRSSVHPPICWRPRAVPRRLLCICRRRLLATHRQPPTPPKSNPFR